MFTSPSSHTQEGEVRSITLNHASLIENTSV